MRRFLLTSILVFFATSMFSQLALARWYTIEEAEKLNATHPKKFIIDVYTDWCGWCKKMDKETFTHPVIIQYLNDNFYAVKLNAEQTAPITFGGKTFKTPNNGERSTNELAQVLLNGQLSYPTVTFLSERLELIGPAPGYKDPKSMEALLVYVKDELYKTQKFDDFMATFKGKIK